VRRRGPPDGVEKAIEIVGRHGEVGIGHEPPRTARFQHPALDGSAFPSPPSPDQPDPPIGGRRLFDDRSRGVAAPVVNDNQLPIKTEMVQVGAQVAQRPGNDSFFVEGGNDY